MKTLFVALLGIFAFVSAPAMAAKISPTVIDGATTVSHEEAKELFEAGVVFVDVRKNSDWDAGRIPGAYHLELKTVFNEEKLAEIIAKNDKVVIYCNGESCLRSSKACSDAVKWGFTNVYYFRDGLPAWENAGFPIE